MINGTRPRHSLFAIFVIPTLLALISAIGLVAALLTDGPLDFLWSAAVAMPIMVVIWALRARRC